MINCINICNYYNISININDDERMDYNLHWIG